MTAVSRHDIDALAILIIGFVAVHSLTFYMAVIDTLTGDIVSVLISSTFNITVVKGNAFASCIIKRAPWFTSGRTTFNARTSGIIHLVVHSAPGVVRRNVLTQTAPVDTGITVSALIHVAFTRVRVLNKARVASSCAFGHLLLTLTVLIRLHQVACVTSKFVGLRLRWATAIIRIS